MELMLWNYSTPKHQYTDLCIAWLYCFAPSRLYSKNWQFKAEVGSLFLVSFGIKFHNNPRWSEGTFDLSTSPWLCIQALENEDQHGDFSANHGSFQRACVPIGCSALHFLATGDLLKQVMCLTFKKWPLATWQAELQATLFIHFSDIMAGGNHTLQT